MPHPSPDPDGRCPDLPRAESTDDPTSSLLGHVLAAHAQDVERLRPAAREDQPEGVHAMRVATRRLRSALATGRPFLDRDVTEPVRDELGWLSDRLGAARDAEVRIERVQGALEELVAERADIDWHADEVAPALIEPLVLRHAQAMAALAEALDGARYADLARRLLALTSAPPWTGRADKPIRTAYRRRLRREVRAINQLMDTATRPGQEPDARAAHLHEARKAVKRARYAVEPLRPLAGKRARRLTRRLKDLQSHLGMLHDTVITREYLDDLVHRPLPLASPSVALVAGALIEREASHAETHERQAHEAWVAVASAPSPH